MRTFRNRVKPSLELLEDRAVPATLTVNNLNDSGADSLRQAIIDTINLQSALPSLSSDIDVEGPGANVLTVQRSTAAGTSEFRVFTVTGNAIVTLAGLTIANGWDWSDSGGGLSNQGGNLTLNSSTV